MKKSMLILVLGLYISECVAQIFTYYSDTCWFYRYDRKVTFEQQIIKGLPDPQIFRPTATAFAFDTKASTLTIKTAGKEDVVLPILNVEKRFKSKRLLKCQVVFDKKTTAEVIIRKDWQTKKIVLRFEYPISRRSKECFADFNGSYDIK
jgi:hypothetical protein